VNQSFPLTVLTALLLVQGAGSLFLAVVLATLYGYRRRASLLFWALAWLCHGLWFLGGLAPDLGRCPLATASWLPWMTLLCGWLHGALWLLGLQQFGNHLTRGSTEAPQSRCLFSPSHLAVLALTVLAAVVLAGTPSSFERRAWLGGLLAVAYLWSTVVLIRFWQKDRRGAFLLLALGVFLYALSGAYRTWESVGPGPTNPVTMGALSDFLTQTFLAVALLVFLLSTEQAERRETVQRLEESEERFRLIFEHSGVGMSLLTRDGRFLQINPALLQMLGYNADELRGRRLADLIYQADATREIHPGRTPGEAPSLYEREKRYIRKDGQSIWARVLRVPIRDAGGQARHYVGVLVDITERKRAEEALAASEQRYRLLNQVAHDGIYVAGDVGEFLEANPAFCRILGRFREDLLQLTLEQVAADPEAVRQHQLRVVSQGGDRLETRLRRPDGSLVDVEMSGARLDLEGRRLLHGICRDISERRRAEAALREAKQRLQEERDFSTQVLETAGGLILVVDPSGRIVRFNATATALSGYREEEARGQVFWELLLPQSEARLVQAEHERLVIGRPTAESVPGFEALLRARDGAEHLVIWRNAAVRDAQSRVRYVISTGVDITQQRVLEEQLRQARNLETLGTLVGGIAHDFNNQLTAVLGHLSMIQSDLEDLTDTGAKMDVLPPRSVGALREPLAHAEMAAQKCADITQRLLTFSRGQVGPTGPVPVDALLAEAERALQRELPANIRMRVERGTDIWPVAGDRTQLHLVLRNLAANAAEAMPQGGTLTLTAAKRGLTETDPGTQIDHPGRYVELSVTDTGKGMSAEVQARLFEPFFTTKKQGQGAGMGLAMAYGIVKAHKGWISVRSAPGEGSTFQVYLPVAGEDVSPTRPLETEQSVEGGAECILVVDDEELVRLFAEAALERAGYRILTAADGEEALQTYTRQGAEIDLVLLDYSMPGLTGLQVLQELKKLNPQVRAIFSSGYTVDQDSDQLLAAGGKAFLAKPYRPDDLLRVVRGVLETRSQGR
jgi:two-component system, cell cycle sensor histidine kinase and response regulator CckA